MVIPDGDFRLPKGAILDRRTVDSCEDDPVNIRPEEDVVNRQGAKWCLQTKDCYRDRK
jgi:hypothetical protein